MNTNQHPQRLSIAATLLAPMLDSAINDAVQRQIPRAKLVESENAIIETALRAADRLIELHEEKVS